MKIKELLEIIKLPLKYLIAIFIVLTILLFSPEKYIIKLGIVDIVESYRKYIGMAFLVDMIFILVHILEYGINKLRARWIYYHLVKKGKRKVRNLTKSEKKILRGFIENESKTSCLPMNNGNVTALSNAHIIYVSSQMSVSHLNFPYNLNEWAWEYLNKNKHLLD